MNDAVGPSSSSLRPIEQILDLARWAPSGDNTQPWRFEIVDDGHAIVHGSDTRAHCVYDLDGHPSQLAIGTLIETAAIAATTHGLRLEVSRVREAPDSATTFHLRFDPDASVQPDPLVPTITLRSVQRRPLSTRPLTADEKQRLQASVGPAYQVIWLEGFGRRLATAMLMFHNAKLRLILPEAYPTHRDVIEWNARFSEDKVPDQALGVDPLTAKLMRWVMKSWGRVQFFNRFLAGTWAPRIQMDLIPGLACGAHFLLVASKSPASIDDYVDAGRAVQRFWLTAALLELQLQPEMTPLIFARYVHERTAFSADASMSRRAKDLSIRLMGLVGASATANAVFMGRIGAGNKASSRSIRLPLRRLMSVGDGH